MINGCAVNCERILMVLFKNDLVFQGITTTSASLLNFSRIEAFPFLPLIGVWIITRLNLDLDEILTQFETLARLEEQDAWFPFHYSPQMTVNIDVMKRNVGRPLFESSTLLGAYEISNHCVPHVWRKHKFAILKIKPKISR